jgi:hypothetical protein
MVTLVTVAVGTEVGSLTPDSVAHDRDAEFADYMAARQPSLLRTAYLLTGGAAA